jgi:hypothetical protein
VSDLQQLLDDRAIRDVVLRYCRGIDRMDRDLVRSCYHPDATDSHGSFEGSVDEFLVWVWRVLARYSVTMHLVANQLIEFVPDRPDRARSESYGVAVHRTEGGAPAGNLITGFRFIDDFERRDSGGWRILRRVATTEWVRVERPEDQWPIPAGMLTGRRDRDDPVSSPNT